MLRNLMRRITAQVLLLHLGFIQSTWSLRCTEGFVSHAGIEDGKECPNSVQWCVAMALGGGLSREVSIFDCGSEIQNDLCSQIGESNCIDIPGPNQEFSERVCCCRSVDNCNRQWITSTTIVPTSTETDGTTPPADTRPHVRTCQQAFLFDLGNRTFQSASVIGCADACVDVLFLAQDVSASLWRDSTSRRLDCDTLVGHCDGVPNGECRNYGSSWACCCRSGDNCNRNLNVLAAYCSLHTADPACHPPFRTCTIASNWDLSTQQFLGIGSAVCPGSCTDMYTIQERTENGIRQIGPSSRQKTCDSVGDLCSQIPDGKCGTVDKWYFPGFQYTYRVCCCKQGNHCNLLINSVDISTVVIIKEAEEIPDDLLS